MTNVVAAVEWSQGIQDAWADVASFIPKFVGFLIILIVGYFLAKLIAKAADAILERVGFDRAVERGGVKRALANSKYDASDILSKIIFYALFLIVLQMAFGVFGPNPISDLLEGVIAYLPRLIAAIIIIIIASAIAAAARDLIEASLGGLSYGTLLANVAAGAILVVGVFAALNQLRIAPAIVNGLFYAVLAIVVGSTIIAVGGGGILPMRQRWDRVLARYDAEKPQVQQAMRGSKERVQARMQQRVQEAKTVTGTESPAVPPPPNESPAVPPPPESPAVPPPPKA